MDLMHAMRIASFISDIYIYIYDEHEYMRVDKFQVDPNLISMYKICKLIISFAYTNLSWFVG